MNDPHIDEIENTNIQSLKENRKNGINIPIFDSEAEKIFNTTNVPILDNNIFTEYKPVVTKTKSSDEDIKWIFSFRYWDQIDYFGLDKSKSKWFVSLFERLKELSKFKRSDIMENYAIQNSLRYHSINWKQKNIPIQREDINWVDKDYLDNQEEYEFFQFQISKSLGRIVGFWDENLVFNIVLFDPLHNIQPSKSYSYKVDKCSKLNCEYSDLLHKINIATSLDELKEFLDKQITKDILIHYTDKKITNDLNELLETGKVGSPTDILYTGIEYIKEL
ncbi:hypothetical protein [Aliarcobacter butzleri]|uniref:hypothetical protein n=1 Tax=Aliarcobacter butzleri TaxID=28197 RepID=UPI001EDB4926|nr:hypothetical protein [Aliarcobacter butzleri]MCG3671902.1 hypothetical protein [Aliarcobacter butzleri]